MGIASRLVRLAAAVLLVAATLLATQHGHLGQSRAPDCATCMFTTAAGAKQVLPVLRPPVAAPIARPPLLVESEGHAARPISVAPKHGPPAA